jgi:hypothetical protein
MLQFPGSSSGRPGRRGQIVRGRQLDEGHVAQDELAGLVGGGQVDARAHPPVVVALRVVDDLLDLPGTRLLGHQEQPRPAGVRAGADRGVLVEVRRQRLRPAGLRAVHLLERIDPAQRRQLDPAEHRVAHQHLERPRL